jgi:glycosyltransferase involved in cell wall biosynthesis
MSINNDAPSPGGRISVAMIVRDESAHLAECLSCIAPLADEICVVDTGSVDDTVSIARQYGCHVARFPWRNDFSAARNVSIDACRGDWIFVLDADERIAPEDLERIRGLMAAGPSVCYRMITRNYTNTTNLSDFVFCSPEDPWARGFAGWYPSGKVRFFPNGVGAQFTGVVHELVNPSLEAAGIEIRTSEIPVHHYPLIRPEAQLRQKQRMYLELGLEKTRQSPEDAKAHAELAVQYVEMGDIHNAVRAYRAAVRLEPENALWIKDLGGSLLMMGRTDDAILALGLALKRKPELADGWRNLGIAHASRSAWPEALDCFLRLKGLIPEDGESRRYLALALEGTGRYGEAALEAWEALRRRPESGEAGALYGRLMNGLGKTEAARSRLDRLEASCGAMPGIKAARSALDL